MRCKAMWLPVVLLASGIPACQQRSGPSMAVPSGTASASVCPPSGETVEVLEDGPGRWRVHAACCLGAVPGQGDARSRGDRPGDGSPALALARARAWAAVARELRGAGRPGEAVTATRRGLEALGDPYAPRQLADDTPLKIAAAEERLAAGNPEDAASALSRVLDSRLGMFLDRHRPDGIE